MRALISLFGCVSLALAGCVASDDGPQDEVQLEQAAPDVQPAEADSTLEQRSFDVLNTNDLPLALEADQETSAASGSCVRYYYYREGCYSCGTHMRRVHKYCVTANGTMYKVAQYCEYCSF